MIIIKHRQNKITQIKNLSPNLGAEIDLRSNNGEIIIHHDPFKEGIKFVHWLKFYKKQFLILNVKEEGLEENLITILNKFKIINYFFLDQSFPFLIKFSRKNFKNSALRFSDYEDINNLIKLEQQINWVWIDYFDRFSLNKNNINLIKKLNFKYCLVSPELHGENQIYSKEEVKIKLKELEFSPDAVCTKEPEFWL